MLHPGKAPGAQTITIERLKPEATYVVTGARVAVVNADSEGRTTLTIDLQGRTPVSLRPA